MAPSLCTGSVHHRRAEPAEHAFDQRVSYVWFDPDHPAAVADRHPLWSATRPAPARFRAADYGDGSDRSLGDQVRDDLAAVLDTRPTGPVRMLTQWRRWGWLFNPITVYLAWHDDPDLPVGAVLEVTNTPWKERHRYATALDRRADGHLVAEVDKVMHVSPFLDEQYRYVIEVSHDGDDARGTIGFGIDVVDPSGAVVLATGMRLAHRPVDRRELGAALRADGFPTHRVSAAIHVQAARLWRKRVPFVAHPSKRRPAATAEVAPRHL